MINGVVPAKTAIPELNTKENPVHLYETGNSLAIIIKSGAEVTAIVNDKRNCAVNTQNTSFN